MLNNYDLKYIFKKVLIFFIIFVFLSFFKSCEVYAETYNVINDGTTANLYSGLGNRTISISFGQTYTTNFDEGVNQVIFKLDTGMVDDGYGGSIQSTLYSGSYLFDFYIVSNRLDSNLSNCKDLNTDYRFVDLTTGNTVIASSSIKSQCINSYYTYIDGTLAIHYLVKFTITNTQSYAYSTHELIFINNLWHGYGFTQDSSTFSVTIGNVYDFDSTIVTTFNNQADNGTIIGQNDTIIAKQDVIISAIDGVIIRQNQAHQDSLDTQSAIDRQTQAQQDTNNIINNDNVDGASSEVDSLLQNSAFQDNSGIQSIINAPLNFIQGLSNSCSPISLTIPYIDTPLTIPCIKSELNNHVPAVVPILSTAINGFVIYRILIDIVYLVKSARNPDDDRIEVLDL